MNERPRILWRWRAALLAISMVLAASAIHAQSAQKTKVLVVITEDDSPCLGAKVTIRPRGEAEGWPAGKKQIVLTAGLDGETSTTLGAGSYRITAVDSMQRRLPALAYFKIKAGQKTPMKIRLEVLYWDCAHVTCEL